jgi:hypothetical protein
MSAYALTILRHCSRVSIIFVIEVEADLFYLSPRPWATITVEVCLRRAGTTRAALVDMLYVCGDYQWRI